MEIFFFIQIETLKSNWLSFFSNKVKKNKIKITLITLNKSVNVYKKARSQYFKNKPITLIHKNNYSKICNKKYIQILAVNLMQKQPQIKIYWKCVVKST